MTGVQDRGFTGGPSGDFKVASLVIHGRGCRESRKSWHRADSQGEGGLGELLEKGREQGQRVIVKVGKGSGSGSSGGCAPVW